MGQSKEVKQKKKKKIDICFIVIFRYYAPNFFYGGDTRHQALSPLNFDIFQLFTYSEIVSL